METNILTAIIILLIGFGLVAYGAFSLGNNKDKRSYVIAIFGYLIVVVGVFFSHTIVEEKKELLTQEVAEKKELLTQEVAVLLDTTLEKIIIEDISGTSARFSSNKNENLRKVFYDKKVYLLEVDGYKIVKLLEVKGG